VSPLGNSIWDLSISVLIALQAGRRDLEQSGDHLVAERRIELGEFGGRDRRLIKGELFSFGGW
jgi:hypothetical protein